MDGETINLRNQCANIIIFGEEYPFSFDFFDFYLYCDFYDFQCLQNDVEICGKGGEKIYFPSFIR